jgi:hypothetical protein
LPGEKKPLYWWRRGVSVEKIKSKIASLRTILEEVPDAQVLSIEPISLGFWHQFTKPIALRILKEIEEG